MKSKCILSLFLLFLIVAGCFCHDAIEEKFIELDSKIENLTDQIKALHDFVKSGEGKLATGPPGRDGRDGNNGKDGCNGRDGNDGRDGSNGKDGSNGRDGRDGLTGHDGAEGPPGPPGKLSGGAVYTRWGRKTCGTSSTLIYEGFAGNSEYSHTGGGTNFQCMPDNPEHNSVSTSSASGHIAGTEYHTFSDGIFPSVAMNENVPCAVCYARNRPLALMIPAKRTCPDNWHREYEGYLMSAIRVYDHPTTFECVDAEPEYVDGESRDTDGFLLFFNTPVCGKGIKCPDYYANRPITCVVCTK